MGCPYNYYKQEETYYPKLYCSINDKQCIYSKRCQKEEKFIPMENDIYKECYEYNMNRLKTIPQGSYFVQTTRPNKSGKLFLYVLMNDKVVKLSSDFTELNQDYVYLKERADGGYNISIIPFPIEKVEKKTYSKKAKTEDKVKDE